MWRGHEIVSYLRNRTRLVDEARATSEWERSATIRGTRKRGDGSTQEIRIEVQDAGPRAGDIRYAVSVRAEGVEGPDPIIAEEAGSLTEVSSNADAHSSELG